MSRRSLDATSVNRPPVRQHRARKKPAAGPAKGGKDPAKTPQLMVELHQDMRGLSTGFGARAHETSTTTPLPSGTPVYGTGHLAPRAAVGASAVESLKKELRQFFNTNGLRNANHVAWTILSGFFRQIERDGTMPSFRDRARIAAELLSSFKDRYSLEELDPRSLDFHQRVAAEDLNNYLRYFESLAASGGHDGKYDNADDMVNKASQMLHWRPDWTRLAQLLSSELAGNPIPGVNDIAPNALRGLDIFVPDHCPSRAELPAAVLKRSLELGCGEILGFWAMSLLHVPMRIVEESRIRDLAPNYRGPSSVALSAP